MPRFIRESISIDTFKRKLKTRLFKKAFCTYHLDNKIVFLAYLIINNFQLIIFKILLTDFIFLTFSR